MNTVKLKVSLPTSGMLVEGLETELHSFLTSALGGG